MPSFKIIGLWVLKKICKGLSIYGHGGHLGHVTKTSFTKFMFPLPNGAPHKIWLWPCGFSEEMFENNGHIHVYNPETGIDNPLGHILFKTINLLLIWSFASFPS